MKFETIKLRSTGYETPSTPEKCEIYFVPPKPAFSAQKEDNNLSIERSLEVLKQNPKLAIRVLRIIRSDKITIPEALARLKELLPDLFKAEGSHDHPI